MWYVGVVYFLTWGLFGLKTMLNDIDGVRVDIIIWLVMALFLPIVAHFCGLR